MYLCIAQMFWKITWCIVQVLENTWVVFGMFQKIQGNSDQRKKYRGFSFGIFFMKLKGSLCYLYQLTMWKLYIDYFKIFRNYILLFLIVYMMRGIEEMKWILHNSPICIILSAVDTNCEPLSYDAISRSRSIYLDKIKK